MQAYPDSFVADSTAGTARSPDDGDALLRLRDQQRADYEAKLEALRQTVLANNRTIAELKARLIHFRGVGSTAQSNGERQATGAAVNSI